MSRNNRAMLVLVVLAIIAVAVFDRPFFNSTLGQMIAVAELAFFVTATLWLWKHW